MGKIRLDKYLADMGQGTRAEVKKAIKKGRVSVNQEVVKSPETKIDIDQDFVSVDGKDIVYEQLVYYMLNKPQGVVSATEDRCDKTVLDLIEDKKRKDLFPVGRLDKDTEGLLLITNDGELAHNLLAPKKHVDKKYYAKLKAPLSEENRKHLEEGVDIGEDKLTMPSQVFVLNEEKDEVHIVIREGKFHQIKRMFHAVGNEVVFLKRLSMGSLVLDENLPAGACRLLTPEEIERLKENA